MLSQKFDKPRFVLCMCFLNDGNLLTGDSNGNILEWPQGKTIELENN